MNDDGRNKIASYHFNKKMIDLLEWTSDGIFL